MRQQSNGTGRSIEAPKTEGAKPMQDFKIPAIQELTDQQVRFAPPARRMEQLTRAEKLIAEVEPDKSYPYQYVCFRLTEFRSNAHADLRIAGDLLRHDLELFARRVERSVPALPIEQAVEPMLTLDEVSRKFNVSTKTISRWRVKGLAARRVKVNGRSQLGFPKAAVEKFVSDHAALVAKGGKFSHLTDAAKDDILRLARELRERGMTLTEVSRKVSSRLGRSPEAVRYTIKSFDRGHPDHAPSGGDRPLGRGQGTDRLSDDP